MTNGLNGAVSADGGSGHVDGHDDDDRAAAGQSGASAGALGAGPNGTGDGAGDGAGSGADGGADASGTDDIPADASAREKRYRLALRETQTERDGLRGERDALRAQIAAGMIDPRSSVGIDLLLASGVVMDDLVGADGAVDAEKVRAAVEGVEEKFGLGARAPKASPVRGRTYPTGDMGSDQSFAAAFGPR